MGRSIVFRGLAFVLLACAAAASSGCGSVEEVTAESASTLAGASGGPGYFDGSGTTVRFSSPSGAAVIGTSIYVADTANHVIRKIDSSGNVSTLAGKFGVPGSADDTTGRDNSARFNSPAGITADSSTNSLYVCDTGNHTIRKIVASSGAVTTVAGSAGVAGSTDDATSGTNVRFRSPKGIAADASGAFLYVADTGNHKIRKVSSFSGATSTYAGSGTAGSVDNVGTGAQFSSPEGVAADLSGNVFVADTANHTIRKLSPSGAVGNVSTLAGSAGSGPGFTDGVAGSLARFSSPSSLAIVGTDLYVADTGNEVVRKIDASAFVTTLAGSALVAGYADGTGTSAQFDGLKGIGADGISLYVADTQNHAVRKVTTAAVVTTVAGNPPRGGTTDSTGVYARFRAPAGAAVIGDYTYVVDTGNHTIRRINKSGVVTTFAGSPGVSGYTDGAGTGALFHDPQGIAAVGSDLYVADSGNHAIRKVDSSGTVTTFAGAAPSSPVRDFVDGTGTAARFDTPKGIASDDSSLFVADTGNHAVRKIVLSSGAVTTLAGTGSAGFSNNSTGTSAAFNSPEGIAVIGSNLYVADTGNHAIRKVVNSLAAPVTTIAGAAPSTPVAGYADGSGTETRFSSPRGIAAVNSILFVADTGNHAIRKVTTASSVTTFVGNPGAATTRDGDASQVLLNAPVGITGVTGTITFTDENENVVRKILY